MAIAALGTAVGFLAACDVGAGEEEVFCTAEAIIYPDGELYGRSGTEGCQFVDADGSLLEVTQDGDPLCYDRRYRGPDGRAVTPMIVDCDDPGALRPA